MWGLEVMKSIIAASDLDTWHRKCCAFVSPCGGIAVAVKAADYIGEYC